MLVPANRLQALLPQRSIRENVALPLVRNPRDWGLIRGKSERERVGAAVKRLQIDARAGSELRRLSGGNQQKVVIARWVAAGFQTLLCFDPTRGIDVGTKHQIYRLLRELADAGSSVLLFTSELPEISLVCDRAIVLFGGEIVAEMPASEADEEPLLRAAHGLSGARHVRGRRRGARHWLATPSDERDAHARRRLVQRRPTPNAGLGFIDKINNVFANHRALIGMPALLVAFLAATVAIHPTFDSFDSQSVAMAALPLAFAAAAQAVVVISGGIDLSIGSVMAVANVLAASTMRDAELCGILIPRDRGFGRGRGDRRRQRADGHCFPGPRRDRHADHRLHLGRRGAADTGEAGRRRSPEFLNLGTGTFVTEWLSNSLILLVVALAAIWIPVRISKSGLRIYATGSDEIAAFRSGVNVKLARLSAYVLSGLFSAIGGVGLTMTTGIGSPRAGVLYTLSGLAAVVIGGREPHRRSGRDRGTGHRRVRPHAHSSRPDLFEHRPEFRPGDPGNADCPRGHGGRPDGFDEEGQMSAPPASAQSRRYRVPQHP